MYIDISRWHTFCFGALCSLTVIRWRSWDSRPRWRQSWWRCTRAIAPPVSLWILCCAILARKTAVRLIFPIHRRVLFFRSPHLVMPREHHTPLLLFSNFSAGFLDWLMRFLNRGERKPLFSHFGHILGMTYVGLFKLYPTSLSCHIR